jgi:Cu+-exporting ATPase
VGVGLAAAAAQAAARSSGSWLLFEGVALAAGAVITRAWFDAEARTPIEAATRRLVAALPDKVSVPVQDASSPMTMAVRSAPSATIRTSDEIVARRGDTIAVDGVVLAGEARVRTHAAAAGPVRRTSGDSVLAGAFVAKGALRIRALRVGDDRAFVRLARFGKGGERDPAPIARAADVVIQWGGLTTVLLALVVLAATEGGGLPRALSAAAAVLLAAPLLAVRRASDSPLVAAATAAAARGIVFQSARALDAAGHVSTVAVAPRGTLTAGKPEVVEVHRLGDEDVATLVALAAGAERVAREDPIAHAILRYADTINARPAEVRRPVYHPGRGVTGATEDGQSLVVGSRRLLLDEGISVAAADADAALAQSRGRAPVFISVDRRVRAVISIEDELRVGARPAIQRIFDLNAEAVLLTGEERRTVEEMAASLDVTHVKAELLPEERGQEVRNLRAAGSTVAVIGKAGVDDPALTAANVGVVLSQAGGHGSEYGVALVGDDIGDAVDALWIAQAARKGAHRATRLAAVAFGLIVAAAAAGLVVPGIAALLAVGVDAYGIRAGARLLHRIALRLPPRG